MLRRGRVFPPKSRRRNFRSGLGEGGVVLAHEEFSPGAVVQWKIGLGHFGLNEIGFRGGEGSPSLFDSSVGGDTKRM